jgi:hypothetical protein
MMTEHEIGKMLESERFKPLWREIERLETRWKGPLRKAKDPAWFMVDDIFEELRAIPRRLMVEKKAVDAGTEAR